MTKAERLALEMYPVFMWYDNNYYHNVDANEEQRVAYKQGYEQAQQDIIALIQSRIDEMLGDAQPNPILRIELSELIKKIND
jgi:hypothetical protein